MDTGEPRRHIWMMQLTVTVSHDERQGIWFVQSSNVPGLNAEAPTLDALVEVIIDVVPDLVAANMPEISFERGAPIPLHLHHIVNARSASAA